MCCTAPPRASAASISASCPGEGGLDALAMAKANAARRARQSRRRRDRHRAGRFRRLHRHAWRSWSASSRRHPAGRGLYREDRHLCQHRRAAAVRRARGFPARGRARRLVDPARALGSGLARQTAVRTRSPNCARRLPPPILSWCASMWLRLRMRASSVNSPRSAARSTKPLLLRRSPTSTSPTRSRAPLASWPNARLCAGASSARRRNRAIW